MLQDRGRERESSQYGKSRDREDDQRQAKGDGEVFTEKKKSERKVKSAHISIIFDLTRVSCREELGC
jgi:hypothetical protein